MRLSFNSDSALTDEQVEAALRKIIGQLGARLGAQCRYEQRPDFIEGPRHAALTRRTCATCC